MLNKCNEVIVNFCTFCINLKRDTQYRNFMQTITFLRCKKFECSRLNQNRNIITFSVRLSIFFCSFAAHTVALQTLLYKHFIFWLISLLENISKYLVRFSATLFLRLLCRTRLDVTKFDFISFHTYCYNIYYHYISYVNEETDRNFRTFMTSKFIY